MTPEGKSLREMLNAYEDIHKQTLQPPPAQSFLLTHW